MRTLTKEEIDLYFIYEESTGKLFYKSRGDKALDARIAGKECRLPDSNGYLRASIQGKTYLVHRIIFFIHTGEWPDFIDHKDNITSNNRFSNLRAATSSQNAYNAKLSSNNTSGVKGVNWNSGKNKWVARCSVEGKRRHIGYFDTVEEAAEALDIFRKQNHGEFARNK